jgi:hypothetical protein
LPLPDSPCRPINCALVIKKQFGRQTGRAHKKFPTRGHVTIMVVDASRVIRTYSAAYELANAGTF